MERTSNFAKTNPSFNSGRVKTIHPLKASPVIFVLPSLCPYKRQLLLLCRLHVDIGDPVVEKNGKVRKFESPKLIRWSKLERTVTIACIQPL